MGAKFTYPDVVLPGERTFIVTGGNTGIGYETAKYIAAHGGRVIIACRSEEKATAAIEKMQKEHKESQLKESRASRRRKEKSTQPDALNIEFMKLDLSSLASTMEFINAFKAKGYPLHVLICNAGIACVPYGETTDGFEEVFQVNYLSHLLIILNLLPALRQSAPNTRIVIVSSKLYRMGSFDHRSIQGKEDNYNRIAVYNNTKLYQMMSMYALDRRLKDSGVGVFALHPGLCDTGIVTNNWTDSSVVVPIMRRFTRTLHLYKTTYQGAATTLVAALDPRYDDQSALYLRNCKPQETKEVSRNEEKQEALWRYSLDCLKDYITEDTLQELEK